MRGVLHLVLPGVGIRLALAGWWALSLMIPDLPSPALTWQESKLYLLQPFAKRGEMDQGIGLLALYSLIRVARAFAIGPGVLFLDEPFGALDALTREALQQELARLCSAAERPVTTVMITNSVEEAILLAGRIVPMTRGPRATLLASIPVGLPRPRTPSLLARDAEAARVRAAILGALTGTQTGPRSSREPAAGDQPVLSLIGAEGES
jgi:hypothetical protein